MSLRQSSTFTVKELKSLKKDELINLLMESQASNSSPASHLKGLNMSLTDTPQALAIQSNSKDEPLHFSTLKIYITNAIMELKEELSRDYNDKLSSLSEDVICLREEVVSLRKELEASRVVARAEVLTELQEQERRRNNVLIFGAQECASDSPAEVKTNDDAFLLRLKTTLGLPQSKIQSFFRLGVKRAHSRPRPLKIIFDSKSEQKDFLRAAPNLSKPHSNGDFRKVFIKPDLTPTEQEADKKLRNELRHRKEKGERVMIRGGRIVPLPSLLSQDKGY
jgi:hypothetical protein